MPTCQLCQNHFPCQIYVDGKKHNLDTRKYCLECSPYKLNNRKSLNAVYVPDREKVEKFCKGCERTLPIEDFPKKNEKSRNHVGRATICKSCTRKSNKANRHK